MWIIFLVPLIWWVFSFISTKYSTYYTYSDYKGIKSSLHTAKKKKKKFHDILVIWNVDSFKNHLSEWIKTCIAFHLFNITLISCWVKKVKSYRQLKSLLPPPPKNPPFLFHYWYTDHWCHGKIWIPHFWFMYYYNMMCFYCFSLLKVQDCVIRTYKHIFI